MRNPFRFAVVTRSCVAHPATRRDIRSVPGMSNTRYGDEKTSQPGSPDDPIQLPPPGTNTQGELGGIGRAAEESAERLEQEREPDDAADAGATIRDRDLRGAGTDQPPRMAGPLGADPLDPHLPEGAQDGPSRGSGARGFDRGVDASTVGAVHQGVKPEDDSAA
jgi:hypothetical protein